MIVAGMILTAWGLMIVFVLLGGGWQMIYEMRNDAARKSWTTWWHGLKMPEGEQTMTVVIRRKDVLRAGVSEWSWKAAKRDGRLKAVLIPGAEKRGVFLRVDVEAAFGLPSGALEKKS